MIIHGHNLWWLSMMTIQGDHPWSWCMMIIHGNGTWWSSRIMMHDDHPWSWSIVVIHDHDLWALFWILVCFSDDLEMILGSFWGLILGWPWHDLGMNLEWFGDDLGLIWKWVGIDFINPHIFDFRLPENWNSNKWWVLVAEVHPSSSCMISKTRHLLN